MEIGRLRHELIFEELGSGSPAQDSFGSANENWVEAFRIKRASFELLGTREFPSFQKLHAETQIRFRFRYLKALDPRYNAAGSLSGRYRVHFNGQMWDIQPAQFDNRKREMTIEAKAIE